MRLLAMHSTLLGQIQSSSIRIAFADTECYGNIHENRAEKS
jgi:hypothetical protein